MRTQLRYVATTILVVLATAPGARAAVQPSTNPVVAIAAASRKQLAAAAAVRARQDATVLDSASARRSVEAQRGVGYSYTDLMSDIAGRRVAFATFSTGAGTVTVELRDGTRHTVGYPPGAAQSLAGRLAAEGASVAFTSGAVNSALDGMAVMLVLLVGIAGLALILRRGGVMKTGNGAAGAAPGREPKRPPSSVPDVRFSDVAGCDEAVEEVAEMKDFLVAPERFQKLGAKMPSGLVLYGEPGTGKTLLAKALAGEAGVHFTAVSGSEFVEKYVGVGAQRIRELFAEARRNAPAVVFIDEVDAVGATRGSGGEGGGREADITLNQLLVEMDGFDERDRVVVVAATNRLDTLDPALLRPGRFSRQVQVFTPDEKGRREILSVHSRGKLLAGDADLDRLAHITAGHSGAQLAEMLNEAAIWAVRREHDAVTNEDLWEGLCRVIAGPKKQGSVLATGEREIVAYHEAGHVLAGELCPSQDKTQYATIEARGRALGFALKGQTDRGLHDEQYLHEHLIFVLGGRAAEFVTYGTVSSGAANDLQQANVMARQAVEKWGVSPRVGQLISEDHGFKHGLSEQMRSVVDEEVRRLVADAYRDAVSLVGEHCRQLKLIAEALLGSGRIDRPEIELAMEGVAVEPHRPRVAHSPDVPGAYEPEAPTGEVIDGRERFQARRSRAPRRRLVAMVRATVDGAGRLRTHRSPERAAENHVSV